MRTIWRRWRVLLVGAACAGVAGAIAPYTLLISPLEHVRQAARAAFKPEAPAELLLRFLLWFALGAAALWLTHLLRNGESAGEDR